MLAPQEPGVPGEKALDAAPLVDDVAHGGHLPGVLVNR
jgi:hypothetical protein